VGEVIEFNRVYRGPFILSEPATVTYRIDDNYSPTPNEWKVAIVPASFVEAFLGGEDPLVYGSFDGRGATGTSVQPGPARTNAVAHAAPDLKTRFRGRPAREPR